MKLMMNSNTVIAVNENDEIVGYHGKMEVHEKGILHRAISVFIFNSKGELNSERFFPLCYKFLYITIFYHVPTILGN